MIRVPTYVSHSAINGLGRFAADFIPNEQCMRRYFVALVIFKRQGGAQNLDSQILAQSHSGHLHAARPDQVKVRR